MIRTIPVSNLDVFIKAGMIVEGEKSLDEPLMAFIDGNYYQYEPKDAQWIKDLEDAWNECD